MLTVEALSRNYGDLRALDDVSFEVRPGRLTGFVGANGSGKTTTMRIILGVLAAHGGSVAWEGRPVTPRLRQRFGYMPEERGLYPKVRVAEQVAWLGKLHGMSPAAAERGTRDLLERLDLTERANDPLGELSLGNQQRAQVAAALVHDPSLLIMDEPFSGLDPIAIDTVLAVLRERATAGVPVLFSSHQLDVVERLCDDVVIISGGRVAARGARDEMRSRFASPRFELVVDSDAGWLRDIPGVRIVELDGARAVFDVVATDAESVDQVVLREALRRGAVSTFAPVVPRLAEIFKETL